MVYVSSCLKKLSIFYYLWSPNKKSFYVGSLSAGDILGVFMVHFRLCSSNIGEISNMFIWIFVQYLSFGKNSSHSIKSCLVVGLLVATFFLLKTVYLFFRRNNAKCIENGFIPLSLACCLNENDCLWYVEWVFCSWKTQKDSRERTAKW